MRVKLARIAHARSGDKGDASNVGLVATSPEAYELLRREVTPERVRAQLVESALRFLISLLTWSKYMSRIIQKIP